MGFSKVFCLRASFRLPNNYANSRVRRMFTSLILFHGVGFTHGEASLSVRLLKSSMSITESALGALR
jgi:hypothetical protein